MALYSEAFKLQFVSKSQPPSIISIRIFVNCVAAFGLFTCSVVCLSFRGKQLVPTCFLDKSIHNWILKAIRHDYCKLSQSEAVCWKTVVGEADNKQKNAGGLSQWRHCIATVGNRKYGLYGLLLQSDQENFCMPSSLSGPDNGPLDMQR